MQDPAELIFEALLNEIGIDECFDVRGLLIKVGTALCIAEPIPPRSFHQVHRQLKTGAMNLDSIYESSVVNKSMPNPTKVSVTAQFNCSICKRPVSVHLSF